MGPRHVSFLVYLFFFFKVHFVLGVDYEEFSSVILLPAARLYELWNIRASCRVVVM